MNDLGRRLALRIFAVAVVLGLATGCNAVNDPECAPHASAGDACCVPSAEVTSSGVQATNTAPYTPTTHWTGASLTWRDGESPGTWVWKGGAWVWVGRAGTILTCTGGVHVFVPADST